MDFAPFDRRRHPPLPVREGYGAWARTYEAAVEAAMDEGVVDEAWLARKPQWARYRFHPVSFAMIWRRGSAASR